MIDRILQLTCSNGLCPSFGEKFLVTLQYVTPGVLSRPNYVCADCFLELALVTEEEIHG